MHAFVTDAVPVVLLSKYSDGFLIDSSTFIKAVVRITASAFLKFPRVY